MINGLSYSDWEDEADRLRQLANSARAVRRAYLTRAQKLLANLEDELSAIDSVSANLSGFDAVRVGCIRDLLVALRISLDETLRLLHARAPGASTRPRKARATT
jgi:hypothetical protein